MYLEVYESYMSSLSLMIESAPLHIRVICYVCRSRTMIDMRFRVLSNSKVFKRAYLKM